MRARRSRAAAGIPPGGGTVFSIAALLVSGTARPGLAVSGARRANPLPGTQGTR